MNLFFKQKIKMNLLDVKKNITEQTMENDMFLLTLFALKHEMSFGNYL